MKKTITILFSALAIMALMSFNTFLNTSLLITVIDDTGNVVEGASVTLYKTMEDYNNENAMYETEKTDDKGRLKFKNVEPIEYYIYVKKGDMDNIFSGQKVKQLEEGRINKINVIIE